MNQLTDTEIKALVELIADAWKDEPHKPKYKDLVDVFATLRHQPPDVMMLMAYWFGLCDMRNSFEGQFIEWMKTEPGIRTRNDEPPELYFHDHFHDPTCSMMGDDRFPIHVHTTILIKPDEIIHRPQFTVISGPDTEQ